jgi:hypothetical protein
MLWRILQAGYDVVYEPSALAYHEHRREWEEVLTQLAGHQRGLTAFLAKAVAQARGRQRFEVLAFFLWRLLKPGVRLTKGLVGRDPLPPLALLRMWGNALLGGPAYLLARLSVNRSRSDASAGRHGPDRA